MNVFETIKSNPKLLEVFEHCVFSVRFESKSSINPITLMGDLYALERSLQVLCGNVYLMTWANDGSLDFCSVTEYESHVYSLYNTTIDVQAVVDGYVTSFCLNQAVFDRILAGDNPEFLKDMLHYPKPDNVFS